MSQNILSYFVDRDDRILDIDGAWDDVAMINDAPGALSKKVLGTSLFDHVAGEDTQDYLRRLMQRVRATGQAHIMEYRCDGPTVRRWCWMEMRAGDKGCLLSRHVLLRSESTENRVLVERANSPSTEAHQCSICNRIRVVGDWFDPFEIKRNQFYVVGPALCSTCDSQ